MDNANIVNNTSKPFGYWNDRNHLQEEADKYNCKIDFLKGCASAYRAAQRQGILDDICKNYKKSDKSYSDLTSKIHCVYVYEIIETHSFYVGRTINLHNRDLSHRRGRKHSDGRITYDGLYIHCETNNIDIPKPKILEENLDAKNSLIREDYWVNKYIEDGWNTLNIAKTGESSGSLGSVKLWTYDKCKEFCKNYEYKNDLKKANYSCYFTCLKNGWFDEFGINDKITYWNSKDKCVNAAKECKNKKEFARKYYGAYIKSLKEGWMEDIDKIFNVDYEFEKQLCDDYKNGCTLLDLKSKYNIGLRKIIKIMSKYGMKPRNKGGFMEKKSNEINPREGFHFVAIDKKANFETLDYLNKGGNLTTHIKKYYGVDVPSLYYRKKYRLENGKEWWEQWFDIKEVKNKETKKCPFCDWKTIDVDNKSGALEMHLRKKHNISRDEYLKLYYNC